MNASQICLIERSRMVQKQGLIQGFTGGVDPEVGLVGRSGRSDRRIDFQICAFADRELEPSSDEHRNWSRGF